jgi:hypothetical protein
MSLPPLWLTLEPEFGFTRILLSQSGVGTLLKARLSPRPAQPGSLAMLLEALSAWQGMPLFAVLDADAEGVSQEPERWARMVGEATGRSAIHVEWSCPPPSRLHRDRALELGDFSSARRLLVHTVTGQR